MYFSKFNSIFYVLSLFVVLNSCDSNAIDSPFDSQNLMIQNSQIEIAWELNSNLVDDTHFSATLTLINNSNDIFPGEGWALYLNSIRPLVAESFLPGLIVTHINGDFFKLEPTNDFESIQPGEKREIEYSGLHFSIKKTDAPQGFYFVFDDGTIHNVETKEIHPFTEEEQVKRTPDDQVEVPTAESIFEKNQILSLLDRNQVGRITPTPTSVEPGSGVFELNNGVEIHYHEYFHQEAEYLANILSTDFGIRSTTHFLQDDWDGSGIVLNLETENLESSEAYYLDVSPGSIEIRANDRKGVFYGVQSLRSLLSNRNGRALEIESVRVEDTPAFGYRGMHLDVARNFQSIEDVKQLLDVMALYKLNRFHFHLTDDEGWRIAIEPLPELVEVGGRRGHTETESNFLIPSYGSGPDPEPGKSFGSGWYTRDEYIDILQYAAARHIEVIPEIDVPGHARAAIIAMKTRAERLNKAGDPDAAGYYRLDEDEDTSQYLSIQNFDDNVINVCLESTYRFMELVFDEFVDMHREAGVVLTTIHVGGDEVPFGVWEESPACRQLMEDEGIDNVRNLQAYFFSRLQTKLEDRNLKMAGWEEVAFSEQPDGSHTPNPDFADSTIPNVWSNIWGSGTEHYAYTLANMGYKVVMSSASTFYFDMAYNNHWKEPGFYWAAMFDTKEPFSFIPFNLYKNAITDNYGNTISPDQFDDAVQLLPEARENILGLQGQLWSETVNQPNRIQYMVLPRLLGLAERAWVGDADWSEHSDPDQLWNERDKAWNEFANRIGQFELNRLDNYYGEIHYRIPTPGAIVENNILTANIDFPGLDIRYEINGGEPGLDSPVYDGPVDVSEADRISIAAFNSLGRSGRVMTLTIE